MLLGCAVLLVVELCSFVCCWIVRFCVLSDCAVLCVVRVVRFCVFLHSLRLSGTFNSVVRRCARNSKGDG